MTRRRLRQPTAWRLMLLAFGLWGLVFLLSYAAALLAPGARWVGVLLVALAAAALPLLVWIYRSGAKTEQRELVFAAVAVSGIAIVFNGLAALG